MNKTNKKNCSIGCSLVSNVVNACYEIFTMTDNEYELAQHCIDSDEFVTIKVSDRYLLFHDNVLNSQLDLGKMIK
jgi:hypothetical protein